MGWLSSTAEKGRVLLVTIILVPILIVIYVIRPVVLIRFGAIYSTRIGHFAANTELYLSQFNASSNKRVLDFFFHLEPVCNKQLKIMWERTLRISSAAKWIYIANCHFPTGNRHVVQLPSDIDVSGVLARTPPHLQFTPQEELEGQRQLNRMGIGDQDRFICFYARDEIYLDSISSVGPRRDQDYRNASVTNCLTMANYLAHEGYYVLRMGAAVDEELTTSNPRIIDYASEYRSDFMDIFLSAKCRFFIGSTGGINAVPRIFRRPVVYVNFVPLGFNHLLQCAPASLVIPKKLWLTRENRLLSFAESIELGSADYFYGDSYVSAEIKVVENDSEEIAAVAFEMNQRLDGTWITSDEDQFLQRRFWEIFDVQEANENFRPRLGAEFLRSNEYLLD